PPPQSPGDRPGAHAVPTRRSSDLRGGEDVGRGALPDLLDEGGGAREVELELDPLVLGLEALAELLEGLLQGGRREDPDRFRAPGTAPVGSSVGGGAAPAADGQHQDPGHGGAQAEGAPHRSSPAGGAPPPGRAGAASITTWVAFTTALATVPGASPSSRAASLLIR